jgi:hypothetical protein
VRREDSAATARRARRINPRSTTPGASPVLEFIAYHEMLHACVAIRKRAAGATSIQKSSGKGKNGSGNTTRLRMERANRFR